MGAPSAPSEGQEALHPHGILWGAERVMGDGPANQSTRPGRSCDLGRPITGPGPSRGPGLAPSSSSGMWNWSCDLGQPIAAPSLAGHVTWASQSQCPAWQVM